MKLLPNFMKQFILLLFIYSVVSNASAQDVQVLVAENASHRKLFTLDEKVKVKFDYFGATKRVAGRVEAVSADTFYIRGLRKSTRRKITAIAIKNIEKVKNFYTGGRSFTGLIAMGGVTGGLFMMVDAITNDAIFFPQATVATAAGTIVASLIPYALVTLAEPSYSVKKKYQFRGMSGLKN